MNSPRAIEVIVLLDLLEVINKNIQEDTRDELQIIIDNRKFYKDLNKD